MLPALAWKDGALVIIDQRKLPWQEVYLHCRTYIQVAQAIEKMAVRGAPVIGIAAAYGVALGVMGLRSGGGRQLERDFQKICGRLARTRPTARNLFWALERMRAAYEKNRPAGLAGLKKALLAEAAAVEREDAETCRLIGLRGARLLRAGWTVLTHCNTGALATAAHGTALGMIRSAAAGGKDIRVLACETRPFLQGARLTVWELERDKIPVTLITDNAAGWLIRRGEVQAVVVGADRIARNGDTANKIGTYSLAVLARENGVPFFVAAPRSTIDASIVDGSAIAVEERPAREVREVGGKLITLPEVPVRNPAFDVTPASLITAIITERGVARPPFSF